MGAEFEDQAEPTVSIQEYLQDVEDQELEVDLVLGGDDGKECTYDKGYMKRQAIFSCLTCTPNGNAGVCTACSLSCHDGHEIVELWTKRNFRCDCGNSKFGEIFCKLSSKKDVENVKNSYNHNFKGVYCTCSRPYPDPAVEDQVEMIQCCMCEDWFHEEHLGLESSDEIPRDEEGEPLYEDFICRACSALCSFLALYPRTIWAVGRLQGDVVNASKDKNVLEVTPSACSSGTFENDLCANTTSAVEHIIANGDPASASSGKESLLGESSEKNMDSNLCTKDVSAPAKCVLGVDLVDASPVLDSKPMFLSKTWREMLCRCEKCIDFYNQKHIAFLLDKEDSIADYEKMAKQKRDENLQQEEGAELSFLDNLGHVEKIEILNGIADMKNEIHTFLVLIFHLRSHSIHQNRSQLLMSTRSSKTLQRSEDMCSVVLVGSLYCLSCLTLNSRISK